MYATLADLIARAGQSEIDQLADRDGANGPDADVIEEALADASSLIDGYVATKYPLPLTQTPPLLKTWATSIAIYLLHRFGAPDHIRTDYEDALSGLEDVAAGRVTLPVAGTPQAAPTTGTHAGYAPPPVFTPDKLRGW